MLRSSQDLVRRKKVDGAPANYEAEEFDALGYHRYFEPVVSLRVLGEDE